MFETWDANSLLTAMQLVSMYFVRKLKTLALLM